MPNKFFDPAQRAEEYEQKARAETNPFLRTALEAVAKEFRRRAQEEIDETDDDADARKE